MDRSAGSRGWLVREDAAEWVLLLPWLLATATLTIWPPFDLAVSAWFVRPPLHFIGYQDRSLDAIMDAILWIARAIGLALLVLSLTAWWWSFRAARAGAAIPPPTATPPSRDRDHTNRRWLIVHRRALAFVCAVWLLAPGLVVNTLIKDHSGRARPVRVIEFGGTQRFTGAFVIADQCPSNCAFVSGHAAFGAMPFAGAYLVRRRRQKLTWLAAGYGGGLLVGLGRIASGAHFASDVLVAVLIVRGLTALCAAWWLPDEPSPPPAAE